MTEKSEIVEIYSIYVQTITANEQRRQTLAAFYLSLVAAGIALLASEKDIQYIAIAIPITIVSLVWFATIRYFRNLAKAKFIVIADLESNFEIKPFTKEWEYYKQEKGRLKIGLTHLELIIPIVIFYSSTAYVLYWMFQPIIIKFAC